MTLPIVSVIVTAYNREQFVGEAIASIQRQTLADFEVLVVDDGSTDATSAVVRSFADRRVRLLKHESNRGIPAARNSGLEAARGKYIAWLDSDDIARPRRLEQQVGFLERHTEVALVGACAGKINAAGQRFGKVRVAPFGHDDIRAWLLFRSAFQQSSTTGRASILKCFPFSLEFPVCEDVDLFIRLSRDHVLRNLPEVLIDRRLHDRQTVETRADLIRRTKSSLQAALLGDMGLSFGADDLERHVRLGSGPSGQGGVDNAFLEWAEDWLRRIVAANALSNVFDEQALSFACSYFWAAAVRRSAAALGPRAIAPRLYVSPVGRGLLTPHAARWAVQAASSIARAGWPGRRHARR